MYVSGFTFIRNAIKYDYPVVESIRSVLPLCDEFIVAIGKSEDDTEALIKGIGSDKIRILHTVWDESLREGGRVLAEETNKAKQAISQRADWAFYIQGDEVVHEKYIPEIKKTMEKNLDDLQVEGLLFEYKHFYGSYDYVGDSRRWYRKEIRVIRNLDSIQSYLDAQGFRNDGKKLRVKQVDAFIYHYGWVKPPGIQQAKQESFNKLWHNDAWMEKKIPKVDHFDYSKIDSLKRFNGSHPQVMKERIDRMNWQFSFDPTKKQLSLKARILHVIEKLSGWRIGEYRNYRII
jgi:hypothetical protein